MNSEQIYQTVRARFDHAQAKKVLKEKYEAKLVFASRGGMWKAGPELISVLQCCPDNEAVIQDLYYNPVKVNVNELLVDTQRRWQEQMNAWLVEYSELERQR